MPRNRVGMPMLIEFSVENYLSFNERVTLSLAAAPEVDETDGLVSNTFEAPGGIRLLKSTLVFGANASGKSNLVKAVDFARRMVMESAKETQAGEPIQVEPFRLAPDAVERGSAFELVWIADGVRYRYHFSVNRTRVLQEELFRAPPGEDEHEVTLFQRHLDEIKVGEQFPEGREVGSKTRSNALFLSVVAQLNGEESTRILDWFRRTLPTASGVQDEGLLGFTMHKLREGAWNDEIVHLVREADLGIVGVSALEITADMLPKNLSDELRKELLSGRHGTLKVRHRAYDATGEAKGDVEFDLSSESEGTKKFIALAAPLLDVLKVSGTIVLDELDARLHPRLTQAIVRLFHAADTNPRDAQLVAATHDTNLLDRQRVRRDQIWFTEKDARGATKLYSLAELDLPPEARYQRDYLLGKYGAVPVIGELVHAEPSK